MKLVRAELLKIRTTSLWWIFALLMLASWGLALWVLYGRWAFAGPAGTGVTQDGSPQTWSAADQTAIAVDFSTAGQFMGLLLAALLGAILVTNEFQQQTATQTFVVTPRRASVVGAKFVAATIGAVGLWALTTLGNVLVAPSLMHIVRVDTGLSTPGVAKAIAMNLVGFLCWAIIGAGAGALIRSQLGVAISLTAAYAVGALGASELFSTLAKSIGAWVGKLEILVPTTATNVLVTGQHWGSAAGESTLGHPTRLTAALVLAGYATITGLIGTAIIRRRDVN